MIKNTLTSNIKLNLINTSSFILVTIFISSTLTNDIVLQDRTFNVQPAHLFFTLSSEFNTFLEPFINITPPPPKCGTKRLHIDIGLYSMMM